MNRQYIISYELTTTHIILEVLYVRISEHSQRQSQYFQARTMWKRQSYERLLKKNQDTAAKQSFMFTPTSEAST